MHPRYFLQSPSWAKLWQESNPNHFFYEFEHKNLKVLVYEYPWHFGLRFWYIPRFCSFNNNFSNNLELINNIQEFIYFLKKKAREKSIVFIKYDFNDDITNLLNILKLSELKKIFFKDSFSNSKTKIIQFTKTMEINLDKFYININNLEINNQNLINTFQKNQTFYSLLDKDARRRTKKSLSQNWIIKTDKSDELFEDFYKLIKNTSLRQNFPIQSKNYFKNLFLKDFTHLIVLYKDNQPLASMLGVVLNNTFIDLYNGNERLGFKFNSQYYLYLTAFVLAKKMNVTYFDFGGYNPNLGFASFKDGFKGEIREFLGPIDHIIKPISYTLIEKIIRLAKFFKKFVGK